MPEGNIQAAKVKLKTSVERLCYPRLAVYHDQTRQAPSLYDQLQSDLAGTQGDTRTPAKSMPPLRIDAVQLLGDMHEQTRLWCPKGHSTPQRLGALDAASWRPQDTDHVTDIAQTVNQWCESIIQLIEPATRKYIAAPCPSCGRDIVYRRDSGGDLVRQNALKWTANVGFECQACKAHWAPEQTLFFSRLLGFSLPEGVLE